MERAQRGLASLLLLPFASKLQQSQLASAVNEIGRIEGSALGFATRACLFEKRFVAEESHALLHRPVVGVESYTDDEPRETDQRLGQLSELQRVIATAEPRLEHHLLAVVCPTLQIRRRSEHRRASNFRFDVAQVLEVEEMTGEHFMDCDVPQRRHVEVPQVFQLTIAGP